MRYMRLRLIGLVVLGLIASSVFTGTLASAEAPSYPIAYDTAFSSPVSRASSAEDMGAAHEAMRIIKCAYRLPAADDPPGQCNGEERDASHVHVDFAIDVITSIRNNEWDKTGSVPEKSLYTALYKLVKENNATGRFFFKGQATTKDASASIKKYIFNGSGGDLFIACDDPTSKGTGCVSGGPLSHMHHKSFQITSNDPNKYATLTQSGDPARSAVFVTSSNFGGRAYNLSFNNATVVYNDPALTADVKSGYDQMQQRRSKKYKKIGNHYFYNPSSANSYWPVTENVSGMFVGSDSSLNGGSGNPGDISRATRIMYMPLKDLKQDPILALLNQVEPDDQCEIKLMHNRFKIRRGVVAAKLVELSLAGCDVQVMAWLDQEKEFKDLHCNNVVRVCPPVLGILRNGNGIKVYSTYVHDKAYMIKARFKDGNGSLETVVQSGSASLSSLNLDGSDELVTFNWNRSVYDGFREHWDNAISRPYTCEVDINTFKLVGSYDYCRKFN